MTLEFTFKSFHDAIWLHEHLYKMTKASHYCETSIQNQKQFVLKIDMSKISLNHLEKAFIDFIKRKKRNDWIQEILKNHFYYEEEFERIQIGEIVSEMLNGKRQELTALLNKTNDMNTIEQAVRPLFEQSARISFDSFLTFRLKNYYEDLISYVEIAIDEYKMEQDYQVYIQMLRDYLQGKAPKREIVRIYFSNHRVFYDGDFEQISDEVLNRYLDRRLLINHPIYIDSNTIAPLLSIAPAAIILYTDHPEQGLIRTIKNIFEERVAIYPKSTFLEESSLLKSGESSS